MKKMKNIALLINGLVTGYILVNSTLSALSILICFIILLLTIITITYYNKD